jgi:hypothetical protein
MNQQWKPITGFEGLYEVSNEGRVRSLDRIVGNRWSSANGKRVPGAEKALRPTEQGYLFVHLYRGSKVKKCLVHRLVAEAFIENPGCLPQVNHLDGCKANNAVANLEWCTGSENCQHAVRVGLYEPARGEDSGTSKLSEADVHDIRRRAAAGEMHREIAADFPVGRKAVTKIVNRQRWAHV